MRRILHLTLAALLMSALCTGVAVAGQPPAPLPPPSGDYPTSLATRIAAINQQLAELPQREAELTAQQKALDGRVDSYNQRSRDVLAQLDAVSRKIDDHNATVASYPDGAPPAIADALNAEAANLNAENQNLKTEAGKIAAEGDDIKTKQAQLTQQQRDLEKQRNALPAELQRLLQQAASALQALAQASPSTVGQAPGGDPARPSSPPGAHPYDAGGDPASRTNLGAALDGYAKDHDVQVDKRPGIASLTPQSLAKLPASQLSQLQLLRAFDGVVGKPNGNYKALYVTPPDQQPTAAQNAFSDALERGGTATAVRDGNTITIDEIERVVDDPTACPPSNSFTAGTQVLLADGSTRPIEQVTPGLRVRATDPITGRTTSEPVLAQITSTGPKQLNLLSITDGQEAGTITATAGHPFWTPGEKNWVAAENLRPSDTLASLPGIAASIIANRPYRAVATVYNLTVANLHTYYVMAGATQVLVHNCGSTPEFVTNIEQAAVDRDWASTTWDQLKATNLTVTTAWYYYADGKRRQIQSGLHGSDATLEAMLGAGIDGPTAGRLSTHVEMKIAAEMIQNDEPDVVIVINNPNGMCAPANRDGCFDIMPRLLTTENRVAVWWKDKDGNLQRRPFQGTR